MEARSAAPCRPITLRLPASLTALLSAASAPRCMLRSNSVHHNGLPCRGSHTAAIIRLSRAPLQQRGRRRQAGTAASAGQANIFIGSLRADGLKFGVVVARFNELVTKLLLEGVLEGIERHGGQRSDVDVAWVPGSFELPVLAAAMAKSGQYDAVITVGAVVRGATAHFDAVVGGTTSGALNAAMSSGVPVIFCVMTTDTMEQAMDRAGGKAGNKGFEAAVTAIETANVLGDLVSKELARSRSDW